MAMCMEWFGDFDAKIITLPVHERKKDQSGREALRVFMDWVGLDWTNSVY